MKARQLISDLSLIGQAARQDRSSVMIHGKPGIGKSDCVRAAARHAGAEVIDFRAALKDPTEAGGMLWVDQETRTTVHFRPEYLPAPDAGPTWLFLDELDKAPPAVQNCLLQLVLDHEINGHRLPDNCFVLSAVNGADDGSYSVRLSTALSSRFWHIDLEPDLPSWLQWAAPAGIDPEILAFLQFRESQRTPALYIFDKSARAFPSPRSWERQHRLLHLGLSEDSEREWSRGNLGDAMAQEFYAFRAVRSQLPNPASVILAPDTAPIPDNLSARFMLSGALARMSSPANFGQVVRYAERLGETNPEIMVSLIQTAVRRDSTLSATPAFVMWSATHPDVLI
jgi:hypothetical protein